MQKVFDFALKSRYAFERGFPAAYTAELAYHDSDLEHAIQAYKFFYPTVSGAAIIKGNLEAGLVFNEVFGILDCGPEQRVFTANSDTPYAPLLLDLSNGPLVVELQPGPLIVCSMDVNQRWVADMGLPGPDAGKGGKHLLVGPDYKGELPRDGFFIHRASSNQQIVGARSLPIGGDVGAAKERLKTIKVYPLKPTTAWKEPRFIDCTGTPQDTTPVSFENTIQFWEILHETINAEPMFSGYHNEYGDLATLGIEKGQPFAPDTRMRTILVEAARAANAQMRVQAFGDRRLDRFPWRDRQWQWVSLRYEDGDFNTANRLDLEAREKWFYQAIGASPAMFRRDPQAGSLYWLGVRDRTGAYLDGGKSYKLTVPLPVPAKLFWSVTIYDSETRSQVRTDQNTAALRSLFELAKVSGASCDLHFGPMPPQDRYAHWIKTNPTRGWFAYFRIYDPEPRAFDGSWKPDDFERV